MTYEISVLETGIFSVLVFNLIIKVGSTSKALFKIVVMAVV